MQNLNKRYYPPKGNRVSYVLGTVKSNMERVDDGRRDTEVQIRIGKSKN